MGRDTDILAGANLAGGGCTYRRIAVHAGPVRPRIRRSPQTAVVTSPNDCWVRLREGKGMNVRVQTGAVGRHGNAVGRSFGHTQAWGDEVGGWRAPRHSPKLNQ